MVHALERLHRFLRPGGILASDQPIRMVDPRDRRRGLSEIYCVTRAGKVRAGYVDRLKPLADFRAAERALRVVVRRRLFVFQAIETYRSVFYFHSLEVLDRVLAARWTESALGAASRRRIHARLRKHPAAQIIVFEDSRLSILRKRLKGEPPSGRV